MEFRMFRSLFLGAVCLFAVACNGSSVEKDTSKTKPENESATNSSTHIVKDDLGKDVELPTKVKRAISLAPNITEIVYAIEAEERLVGVTTFCNYPADAKNKSKVGDTLKPNIESIIALKPDVVLVSTASQLESFSNVLKKRNIAVFVTNPDTFDGVLSGISKIGKVFGAVENAAVLTSQMNQKIHKYQERLEKVRRPGVFVQIDPSLYTIGKGSFISDVLTELGLKSVTGDIDSPYPKISKERARVLKPGLIILSASPGNELPNDVFGNSPAVKEGMVLKLDADVLSRPGPRIVDAAETITEFIEKGVR